jgi:hypothetical protein
VWLTRPCRRSEGRLDEASELGHGAVTSVAAVCRHTPPPCVAVKVERTTSWCEPTASSSRQAWIGCLVKCHPRPGQGALHANHHWHWIGSTRPGWIHIIRHREGALRLPSLRLRPIPPLHKARSVPQCLMGSDGHGSVWPLDILEDRAECSSCVGVGWGVFVSPYTAMVVHQWSADRSAFTNHSMVGRMGRTL